MKNISLSSKEKLLIISNLATMLAAGIPIIEAIDSSLEDATGNQKKILLILKEDLNQGKNIYESFSKNPKAFDPITINLVRAAEQSGTLDTTLKDIAANIKKEIEFNDKIKGALAYPILVIGVFAGVMLMMLTYVIPKISSVFSRLKVNLPLPTKILIIVSNFFLAYTIPIIITFIIFCIGAIYLYKTQKRALVNFLYSLPFLATLARQIDLTHFSRSLSLLLTSGIPIIESLDLSIEVISKKDLRSALVKAKETVYAGGKLSDGLRGGGNKIIPSIVVRITEASERSGTLQKSMQDLSEYFDLEVSNTLKTLTILLEPVLLVVIGLLVGGMMLAIIAPIYNLIGQIKGS